MSVGCDYITPPIVADVLSSKEIDVIEFGDSRMTLLGYRMLTNDTRIDHDVTDREMYVYL